MARISTKANSSCSSNNFALEVLKSKHSFIKKTRRIILIELTLHLFWRVRKISLRNKFVNKCRRVNFWLLHVSPKIWYLNSSHVGIQLHSSLYKLLLIANISVNKTDLTYLSIHSLRLMFSFWHASRVWLNLFVSISLQRLSRSMLFRAEVAFWTSRSSVLTCFCSFSFSLLTFCSFCRYSCWRWQSSVNTIQAFQKYQKTVPI